jgi:N-acetylgalactosamine-N,N'-diacetylbacillosaminyl-diphospho-undecaprenol 4-alpha-N-acetylgalactosaminyltransferase
MQDKKYKIALVGYRLSGGGLEKVMSSLSIYFDIKNIEVHVILLEDFITYSYGGKLVNIGTMHFSNTKFFAKWKSLIYLKKYISENDFDQIIDFRYRLKPLKELIYSFFVFNSKTIYTIHSSKLATYLPNNIFVTKLITRKKTLVCVSNEIKELIKQKHNLSTKTIYNPIDLSHISKKAIENNAFDFEYIIAIGKYDAKNVKQFDKLIASYSKSILPKNKIKLILLGVGENNSELKMIANQLKVEEEIIFLDFDENPYKYLTNAKFLVLCSKYEGFPMSIIEALACNTPVISFNCVSGPKEIIIDRENGLLVENQNFEKLTLALNEFISDQKLYNYCKKNSLESVSKFSIEKIGQEWLDLMKIDINS